MSIYQRKGSRYWWAKVCRPGCRPMRVSTGATDEKTARAIEQTLQAAQRRDTPAGRLHRMLDVLLDVQSITPGLPVNAIWPEYERICRSSERPLSHKTMLDRRNCVRRLLSWLTETHPLLRTMQDVSTVVASSFADHLRKSGAASKTRRNIVADLGTVWRTVGTVHDCASPWGNVIPLATVTTPGRAFSREEEESVLKAADAAGHGWGLMCRVARCTGLRYGDVARIEGHDVDRDAKALRLNPSKTRRHGISVVLPLSDALVAMLPDTHGPLFKEAASHYPDMIRAYPFSRVLADAGLSGRGHTFHSWRHTFRTRLSEAGVSDDIAKRLGGWTQDTTAARYDHAKRLDDLRAAVTSAGLG